MHEDTPSALSSPVFTRGTRGWQASQTRPLPAGYAMLFATYRHRTGMLMTDARVCRAGTPVPDATQLDAPPPFCEAFAITSPPRFTRAAVRDQHVAAVAANEARACAAAQRRYRFHAGPGPALDGAVAALPPGLIVHTFIQAGMLAGAGVSRSRIIAAMREGFAIDDALGLGHPIVTVIDGRQVFVEADPHALERLARPPATSAWRELDAERLAQLQAHHALYRDWNQKARLDDAMMAARGHPDAPAYRRLRAFFDRLRFANNASARFYTWIGEHEYAAYWAPRLSLSWYPTGLPDYCHVYPAHDRWHDYIDAAAAADWPPGVAPGLVGGQWTIATCRPALRDALADFAAEQETATCTLDKAADDVIATVRLRQDALALHARVLRLLRQHQRDGILPRRQACDDAADTCSLPLAEKRCMLGNVKQVTINDRHVLIPLVPPGLAAGDTILQAVRDLIALVEEGLPFEQASDWLRTVLKADAYGALQRRHGGKRSGTQG